jgi:hypothetical protein
LTASASIRSSSLPFNLVPFILYLLSSVCQRCCVSYTYVMAWTGRFEKNYARMSINSPLPCSFRPSTGFG